MQIRTRRSGPHASRTPYEIPSSSLPTTAHHRSPSDAGGISSNSLAPWSITAANGSTRCTSCNVRIVAGRSTRKTGICRTWCGLLGVGVDESDRGRNNRHRSDHHDIASNKATSYDDHLARVRYLPEIRAPSRSDWRGDSTRPHTGGSVTPHPPPNNAPIAPSPPHWRHRDYYRSRGDAAPSVTDQYVLHHRLHLYLYLYLHR